MKTNKSKSQSTPSLLPLTPAGRRSIGATARGGTQKISTLWSQPPGPRLLYEPDCALVALLQSTGNSPAGEALGLLAAAANWIGGARSLSYARWSNIKADDTEADGLPSTSNSGNGRI